MSANYISFLKSNAKFSLNRDINAAHRYTRFGLAPRATKKRSVGDRYTGHGSGTRGRCGVDGCDQVEMRRDFGPC